MAAGLIAAWQRLGVPQRLQLDNDLVFWGSNRHPRSFGLVIRLCLDLRVEPIFIPLDEPWRNGIIERFQGVWDQRFFRAEHFVNFAQLEAAACEFEMFHNAHHRCSILRGHTPNETEAAQGFRPDLLPRDFEIPLRRPRRGRIHVVRFIRRDRVLRIASERFLVEPALVHEGVTATILVEAESIEVYHADHLVQTFEYRLPKSTMS